MRERRREKEGRRERKRGGERGSQERPKLKFFTYNVYTYKQINILILVYITCTSYFLQHFNSYNYQTWSNIKAIMLYIVSHEKLDITASM